MNTLLPIHQLLQDREFFTLRDRFRSGEFDMASEPEEMQRSARRILNIHEVLGAQYVQGTVDIQAINGIFHSSVVEPWRHLEPYIMARREQEEGWPFEKYAGCYEQLVRAYVKRGYIPASRVELPEADPGGYP